MQAGALTPGGYVDLVKPENLLQFSDTEAGEEPEGLEVQVVEQDAVGKSGCRVLWNYRWQHGSFVA